MPQVKETPHALNQIKGLRLQKRYAKQKALFISNPAHRSLDFCMWDHKYRICSFKITNKYRVKIIKDGDIYTVIDAGDYH